MRERRNAWGILMLLSLACTTPASDRQHGQTPEWTLERRVTIGDVDHPYYGLSVVSDVLADDEHVYVLLPEDGEIRVFTRDGEFVRNMGGRGEGPGEMMFPGRIGWFGSATLWVADGRAARFTLFDVATGEAETVPFRVNTPEMYHTYGMRGLSPTAILANGQFAAAPQLKGPGLAEGVVTKSPVVVVDTAGTIRDTLALLSVDKAGEITAGLVDQARRYVLHSLPERDILALAPNGSSGVIINRRSWTGTGPAAFSVTRIDLDGDTLFHRRFAYEPVAVPDDFYDERITESLESSRYVVDRRAFADALREFFKQRRFFPPVTAVAMGMDYTTWLAGPAEGGARDWLVLDERGSPIGRFRLPTDTYVLFANKTECWVEETGRFDIPYIVRYDVIRPP